MTCGVILFNTSPMLHNLTTGMYSSNPPVNGTFAHCCYYALPFDYTTKFTGYLAVFLANCVLTFDAGSCLCIYDLYISLIVFHAWGHLKILDHHLRHFPRPVMEGKVDEIASPVKYNEEECEQVTAILKKLINHHRLIMKWVNKNILDYIFSIMLQWNSLIKVLYDFISVSCRVAQTHLAAFFAHTLRFIKCVAASCYWSALQWWIQFSIFRLPYSIQWNH